jgi:hypothetical protein
MSVAGMRIGGVSVGDVNIVVMLLTAAAVLVWPGDWHSVHSARVLASSRSGAWAGQDREGAGSGGGRGAGTDAGVGADAEPRVVRPAPVAEVAGVIDLLALTLRSGAGLVEAMEAVSARVGGQLGLHLRTVAAASRWGVEDATAWASVPSAWQPAARALRMAASAGVPPADALAGAADEVRRAERQRLEVATATLGVRIVLPLGLVFLPAFILTTVVPIVLALARQVLSGQ